MARIIGILDLHNDPSLGQLTKEQPVGSTSFLGRYALMDFALSNFANSGINIIELFNPYHTDSIRSHIRTGNVWVTNTKLGFVRIFVDEEKMNDIYFNTDINNMLANIKTMKSVGGDYVIIANSHFFYSCDFKALVEKLEDSDADILSVYKTVNEEIEDYLTADNYKFAANKIISSKILNDTEGSKHVSLDTYIMKTSTLYQLLEIAHKKSQAASIRSTINDIINDGLFTVIGHEYDGYVVPILSFEHYVKHSLKLLSYSNRKQLFLEDWPILTTTHNTPPALYGKDADVKNSFVANGSIIKGTVRNSILSRDVIVEEGAVVEDCILFTDTLIGKDVKISNIVANKKVKIINVDSLKGTKDQFVYIKREEII
jgi:glucose-1-phosphate adenylyltransferase